jgi:uncharacterized membrane protein (DUF373 family)
MASIEDLLNHYSYTKQDEENRRKLAELILAEKEQFASDFYAMLEEDPYTAQFFPTQESINKRKTTFKYWLKIILTSPFDHRLHLKLERVGKTHVRIGLDGHYVNASMNFVRRYCQQILFQSVSDTRSLDSLLDTLNKVLDIGLDIMTASYREAELKKVFLSKKAEYWMVRWAERIMHGLNLVLMVGLLLLAAGVTALLSTDIYFALSSSVEQGVIRALGSLLILWMMVELLHAQVEQLKGGKFHVRIFVDLAMVAFIRKIFVASLEGKDPWSFGLLIGALLVLGIIYFLLGHSEKKQPGSR